MEFSSEQVEQLRQVLREELRRAGVGDEGAAEVFDAAQFKGTDHSPDDQPRPSTPDSISFVDGYGTTRWVKPDSLGFGAPSMVVGATGEGQWRRGTLLHRTDGPAVLWPDGSREWHLDGQLHRVDGPAVERADDSREWWLRGVQHRVDGPAVEGPGGTRLWFVDGQLHRLDGPAVEGPGGRREWWLRGVQLSHEEFEDRFCAVTGLDGDHDSMDAITGDGSWLLSAPAPLKTRRGRRRRRLWRRLTMM